MLRSCLHSLALTASISILGSAGAAWGQDMVLSQMYGSGVHAYFSGQYQQAMTDLGSAIDAGSKDPRAYYFRGLAAMRMGQESSAQQDFKSGADLEAKTLERFYPVSRSLERVQGRDRIAVERFRAQARAVVYQEKQTQEQARYERLRRAEESVLRSTPVAAPIPAVAPTAPGVPAQPKVPAAADDPFADSPPAEAAPKPAAPPAAEEDPFGADEPAPAPPAAEDDPFADDAPPAEEKKPAENPPAEGDDPFAG